MDKHVRHQCPRLLEYEAGAEGGQVKEPLSRKHRDGQEIYHGIRDEEPAHPGSEGEWGSSQHLS